MRVRILLAIAVLVLALASAPEIGPHALVAAAEGRVSGVVWRDDNGDGIRQGTEAGIESHELRLKSRQTGAETAVRTSADGAYEFTALAAGPYEITIRPKLEPLRIVSSAGFFTSPAIKLNGPLTTGITISPTGAARVDFGIYPARNEPGFFGSVWVDAAPAPPDANVRAFVGDAECGFFDSFPTPMRPPSYYTLRIASADVVPGCGRPGSIVTFRVNGRTANETAVWRAGEVIPTPTPGSPGVVRFMPLNTLNLTAGPHFARFWGTVQGAGESVRPDSIVEAWIDGIKCGEARADGNFTTSPGTPINPYLGLAVVPAELEAGCGRDGALVTFTVDGVPFGGQARWRHGRHQVDLIAPPQPLSSESQAGTAQTGPIRPPEVGDAGLLELQGATARRKHVCQSVSRQ